MYSLLVHKIASTKKPRASPGAGLFLATTTPECSSKYMSLLHKTARTCFKFHIVLYIMIVHTCMTDCRRQTAVFQQEQGCTNEEHSSTKALRSTIKSCWSSGVTSPVYTPVCKVYLRLITADTAESVLEASLCAIMYNLVLPYPTIPSFCNTYHLMRENSQL